MRVGCRRMTAARPPDGVSAIVTPEQIGEVGTERGGLYARCNRGIPCGSGASSRLARSTGAPCFSAFSCGRSASARERSRSAISPSQSGRGPLAGHLECARQVRQISLHLLPEPAPIHVLVNGFGWQGTAAPLAPCCNGAARSFFPWASPIPRGTKKPRSAPSSTALRPLPTPKSITFWGPRAGCSGASPCLKPAIEAANERGVRPTRRN